MIRGGKGIRTPDLLHAMQTRYQLRHTPESGWYLAFPEDCRTEIIIYSTTTPKHQSRIPPTAQPDTQPDNRPPSSPYFREIPTPYTPLVTSITTLDGWRLHAWSVITSAYFGEVADWNDTWFNKRKTGYNGDSGQGRGPHLGVEHCNEGCYIRHHAQSRADATHWRSDLNAVPGLVTNL